MVDLKAGPGVFLQGRLGGAACSLRPLGQGRPQGQVWV